MTVSHGWPIMDAGSLGVCSPRRGAVSASATSRWKSLIAQSGLSMPHAIVYYSFRFRLSTFILYTSSLLFKAHTLPRRAAASSQRPSTTPGALFTLLWARRAIRRSGQGPQPILVFGQDYELLCAVSILQSRCKRQVNTTITRAVPAGCTALDLAHRLHQGPVVALAFGPCPVRQEQFNANSLCACMTGLPM